MVVQINIDLSGDKALMRSFKRLTEKQFVKAIKSSTGKSMTPVAREARKRVPVREGVLRKSIGKRTTATRAGNITTIIGPKSKYLPAHKRPSNLAHMIEFGTKRTKPQPFMRPALAATEDKAQAVFRKSVWAWIQKNAKSKA